MELKQKVEVIYSSLQEHLPKAKLLLLHPASRYRMLVMSMLVQDNNYATAYYALQPSDDSLSAFLPNVVESLDLDASIADSIPQDEDVSAEKMDALCNSITQALAAKYDDAFWLVLDEYDRSDEIATIQKLVIKLLDYLPDHIHLVINSRTMPRLPWLALLAKGQATMMRDDQTIVSNFYEIRGEGEYDLQAYGFGNEYVLQQEKPVENWEGTLPRLLFFFVLDRGQVSRSEICQAFWPDLNLEQAVNVFHVTKRRLHKALGIDVLVHHGDYYQVNRKFNIYYDVLEFVEQLIEARNTQGSQSQEAWQRAIELYRGDFMQGQMRESWLEESREAYKQGFAEAQERLKSN